MQHFKTVLGDILECDVGITLAHEHICCYSEYLHKMAGADYIDKEKLLRCSVDYLKELKEKYKLQTFIDCTPINIGRDIELLKKVSEKSGVNIICSTGFYYTDEPPLYNTSIDDLCDYIATDAKNINAGIIKCAVENEIISPLNEKLLRASAKAQLKLNLPIVMHTNARNKNGIKALEIILSEGVNPQAVTVAHLSDTDDVGYIKQFAECGCYIGLDRLYDSTSDEYIESKLKAITTLCETGYSNNILLSHDALFFNGFDKSAQINKTPRLNYCFDYILPQLPEKIAKQIMTNNVLRMLKCTVQEGNNESNNF